MNCRQSKIFLNGPDNGRSRCLIGLVRKDLRVMVGILTGNFLLNRHLSMIEQKDQSQCDRCGLEETAEHFVAFRKGFSK